MSLPSTSDAFPFGSVRPLGEGLNFLSHFAGLLLAIAGAAVLLRTTATLDNRWAAWGCDIYAATLIMVYAASALSHAFYRPTVRHFFRTLDQMCIFLLIAGTYTPWGLCFFRDGWGAVLLAVMWGLALLGVLFKLLVKGLNNVATVGYVVLGWLPVLAVKPLVERAPAPALYWMATGGLLYTLGTWFLKRDVRYPYFHVVWHVMVIAASACHFAAVMLYLVPSAR